MLTKEKKIIQPEISEMRYNLELTPEQAVTLATILQHIGGHPETTMRGYVEPINLALNELVNPVEGHVLEDRSCSIYFRKGSNTDPDFLAAVERARK